jgi:hypothetical protein
MSPQPYFGLLLALLCWPAAAQPPAQGPSLELLQFLAEFGDVDGETFDLIEHHAQQDQAQSEDPESSTKLTQEDAK